MKLYPAYQRRRLRPNLSEGDVSYAHVVSRIVNRGMISNPPGSFNGHWITESGANYYDPSYGSPAVAGANKGKLYEDGAFSGFGADYALPNNGGQFTGVRKNNTTAPSPSEVDYFNAN